MTTDQLTRIKALRDANRAAMEQERLDREAKAKADAEAEERAKVAQPQMMVNMVDLILKTPGRPLTQGQLARMKEIRLRNAIMAEVNRLQSLSK